MAGAKEEYVVPLPNTLGEIPIASQFRGTWLTSSLRALDKHGLYASYLAQLSAIDRETIPFVPAMSWVPTEVVVRHYEACDRLQLADDLVVELGGEVTERVHASSLALGRSLAAASGVTPWTVLERLDKFWGRVVIGGRVAVARLGPKEARVEIHGFPVARIRYNRIGARGIVRGLVHMFCGTVWVHEVPRMCNATTLAYRAQWV